MIAFLLVVGTGSCLLSDDGEDDPTACPDDLRRSKLIEAVDSHGTTNEDRDLRGAELVWPLSGTDEPMRRLSGTFGPRIKVSEDRYDFHRGIDLPAENSTDIHAVVDGTVRLAGEDADYQDPVVQIEHRRDDGEVYYSNYLHLASWSVEVGEQVERGDNVAEVGESVSGFPHLHFEIREGGVFRHHAVHPLSYLPYPQMDSPVIDRLAVERDEGGGRVSFTVELPHTELDLAGVGLAIAGADGTTAVHDFDMVEANAGHEDWETLDDPEFRGDLRLDPEEFHSSSQTYRLDVAFRQLDLEEEATVMVFAEDLGGEQTRRFLCVAETNG